MKNSTVLDTNAIIRGSLDFSEGDFLITPEVYAEILSPLPKSAVDAAIESKSIKLASADPEFIEKVQEKAIELGEDKSLSPQDTGIIALSLQSGSKLISDDYSIQNTAMELGITVINSSQNKITKKRRYGSRCSSCRKQYTGNHSICDVCGGPVVKYIKKEK